ncbi:MAG: hypothetical protein JSV58_03630 [Candidatus Bathyarchaeota archaeon]|nr:MAG: hypothetical protein JSV58_03630 [Candidatus Bathyarchaeota archaeon]
MNAKISLPSRAQAPSVAYILAVLTLAVYGLVAYSVVPIVNVIAMTIALYAATSLVVGGGVKNLFTVLTVSILSTIVSDLCFATLQPFIAFCLSFFVLLVALKYSVIRDHDSGWFGALGAQFIGMILLMVIEIALGLVYLFPI